MNSFPSRFTLYLLMAAGFGFGLSVVSASPARAQIITIDGDFTTVAGGDDVQPGDEPTRTCDPNRIIVSNIVYSIVNIERTGNVSGDIYDGYPSNRNYDVKAEGISMDLLGDLVDCGVMGGIAVDINTKNNNDIYDGYDTSSATYTIIINADSTLGAAFTDNIPDENSDVSIAGAQDFESVHFGYSGDANISTLHTKPAAAAQPGAALNTGSTRSSLSEPGPPGPAQAPRAKSDTDTDTDMSPLGRLLRWWWQLFNQEDSEQKQ